MRKLTLDEIIGLERYEQERDEHRRRVIALKKHRRVAVGDRLMFVFENHDTMWFQTQEMLRAEHIVDLDRVRDEVAVYNELIPEKDELSATLLIEITDSDRIREDLNSLVGIDECVWLDLGAGRRIRAAFEAGRSEADRLSAVQYIRFALNSDDQARLSDFGTPVALVVDHPNYQRSAVLPEGVRGSLAADFLEP